MEGNPGRCSRADVVVAIIYCVNNGTTLVRG